MNYRLPLTGHRKLLLALVAALGVLLAWTFVANAAVVNAQVSVEAHTSGFGAAFAYAQTIGPVAFTQAGSIGNGSAEAHALSLSGEAFSFTSTGGAAAAFAQAIGSPFGSAVYIQAVSSFDGFAVGSAFGAP